MSRTVLLVALSLTGCFYSEPFHQRPVASIVNDTVVAVYRGDPIMLDAVGDDPNGGSIAWQWDAYACTGATAVLDCDQPSFDSSQSPHPTFIVPPLRGDQATPTTAMQIVLHGTDSDGAAAEPALLEIPINDHAPVIAADDPQSDVNGIPQVLYALVTDQDDALSPDEVTWTVLSPPDTTYTIVPGDFTMNPGSAGNPPSAQYTATLTPSGNGAWSVIAVATDPARGSGQQVFAVNVGDDQAAYISQVEPIAATPPDALPISEPTLFAVLLVTDDLDMYPPDSGNPAHGTPQFAWSLLPPGAAERQPLTETGNSVAIDPALYAPGDVLELRVEIADRAHPLSLITCADALPTCSEPGSGGNQRVTWRMEIR